MEVSWKSRTPYYTILGKWLSNLILETSGVGGEKKMFANLSTPAHHAPTWPSLEHTYTYTTHPIIFLYIKKVPTLATFAAEFPCRIVKEKAPQISPAPGKPMQNNEDN